MKISELTSKGYLGKAGAVENSYVLINYEDNSTNEPVTYKASIRDLGKAIVNDLQLYKKTVNGAVTTTAVDASSKYTDGTAEELLTANEKDLVGVIGYNVTSGDSTPHLTATKYGNTTKILDNKDYVDASNNTGVPVVYDAVSGNLKYINEYDKLIAIDGLGGGTPFTAGVSEHTYSYLFMDNCGNAYTIDDSGISPSTVEVGVPLFYITDCDVIKDCAGNILSVGSAMANGGYTYNQDSYTFMVYDSANSAVCYAPGDSTPAPITNLAYIGESSSRPAIYDYSGTFKGFLSET